MILFMTGCGIWFIIRRKKRKSSGIEFYAAVKKLSLKYEATIKLSKHTVLFRMQVKSCSGCSVTYKCFASSFRLRLGWLVEIILAFETILIATKLKNWQHSRLLYAFSICIVCMQLSCLQSMPKIHGHVQKRNLGFHCVLYERGSSID